MSRGSVRRSQLIAPFGVGAMTVVTNGTSLLAAGLDHWFEQDDGSADSRAIDIDEFVLEEWRLQAELRVDHFRTPPDWRSRAGDAPNQRIPIPFQRFPTWNFCPRCHRLQQSPLTERGKVRCIDSKHEKDKYKPYVAQVPIVAICEYGHLQDFPWREWVHQSLDPQCRDSAMRLKATGGASLAAQRIDCDCGKTRTLAGVTTVLSGGTSTYLTATLSKDDEEFSCRGGTPWHGTADGEGCGRPIRGSLRAATNLYFALVKSAIYLPRSTAMVPEELVQVLATPPVSTLVAMVRQLGSEPTSEQLTRQYRDLLVKFSSEQIDAGIKHVAASGANAAHVAGDEDDVSLDDVNFRRPEFDVLRKPLSAEFLSIKEADIATFGDPIARQLLSGDADRQVAAKRGHSTGSTA